jgi:hypothetical protein
VLLLTVHATVHVHGPVVDYIPLCRCTVLWLTEQAAVQVQRAVVDVDTIVWVPCSVADCCITLRALPQLLYSLQCTATAPQPSVH